MGAVNSGPRRVHAPVPSLISWLIPIGFLTDTRYSAFVTALEAKSYDKFPYSSSQEMRA